MTRVSWYKKCLVVGIIILFIGLAIIPSTAIVLNNDKILSNPSSSASPQLLRIIYVDDDNTEGPWDGTLSHPYKSVRAGVNAAEDGDIVFVFNGYYRETNSIDIDSRITIIGENRDETIVYDKDVQFFVQTDSVTISSLTIDASGSNSRYSAAVMLASNFGKLTNCRVIKHSSIGIWCGGIRNTVSNNIIMDHGHIGILITYNIGTVIRNNHIENNIVGVDCSYSGDFNTIVGNNFINNGKNGYFYEAIHNFWNRNYWDDWNGIIPYVIHGKKLVPENIYSTNLGYEDWKNYDWNPAEEPYDISNIEDINSDIYTQYNFRLIQHLFLHCLERFPLLNLLLQRLRN